MNSVSYAQVKDGAAGAGKIILEYPGGTDRGHNVNWAIGLNPPGGIQPTSAQTTLLSYGWNAASPTGDSYLLQVSSNASFSPPVAGPSTSLLSGTTTGLLVNTTYFAQIASVINGSTSAWSTS